MRIDVEWLSKEKHLLHVIFHCGWDWDDYHHHQRLAKAMVEEVNHPVDIIVEQDRDASLLPVNALRRFSTEMEIPDPRLRRVVVVSASQTWRVVFGLLKRLLPNSKIKNVYLVQTREDALKLLEVKPAFSPTGE